MLGLDDGMYGTDSYSAILAKTSFEDLAESENLDASGLSGSAV